MKHIASYQLEDFLQDASFRNWVLEGAFKQTDSQWSRWLEEFPEKKRLAQSAREILLATRMEEEPFPEDYFADIEENVLSRAAEHKRPYTYIKYGIAASVALLLAWGGWRWAAKGSLGLWGTASTARLSEEAETLFTSMNTTPDIIPVALPDGSSVLLHPRSELRYKKTPDGVRMVELKGKAFFEVTPKGPAEPFRVTTGEMVTRVLGTSFTVTAFENEKHFSVIVKTGKVAVNTASGESGNREAIMLTPNEQVSFSRENASFTRESISRKEIETHTPTTSGAYVFDDTPATEVFKRIGKEYGLEIIMDEAILADCGLTTHLSDEPLFQKLGIICSSIGPTTGFVVSGNQIRIFSEGCNY